VNCVWLLQQRLPKPRRSRRARLALRRGLGPPTLAPLSFPRASEPVLRAAAMDPKRQRLNDPDGSGGCCCCCSN
jgi:hypothetical protein